MGNPVVHFEVLGKDGEKLKSYYSEMFGWEIRSDNPMNYGIILREENLSPEGIGIGGGIMGMEGSRGVLDLLRRCRRLRGGSGQGRGARRQARAWPRRGAGARHQDRNDRGSGGPPGRDP